MKSNERLYKFVDYRLPGAVKEVGGSMVGKVSLTSIYINSICSRFLADFGSKLSGFCICKADTGHWQLTKLRFLTGNSRSSLCTTNVGF